MNFLDKLDMLMLENNLNKKSLANDSGIAYTTIVNWYKRGYDNMTISIFKKLCEYFGVTMDSMARNEVEKIEYYNPKKKDLHISKKEEIFLKYYRAADDIHKSLAECAVGADTLQDGMKKEQRTG